MDRVSMSSPVSSVSLNGAATARAARGPVTTDRLRANLNPLAMNLKLRLEKSGGPARRARLCQAPGHRDRIRVRAPCTPRSHASESDRTAGIEPQGCLSDSEAGGHAGSGECQCQARRLDTDSDHARSEPESLTRSTVTVRPAPARRRAAVSDGQGRDHDPSHGPTLGVMIHHDEHHLQWNLALLCRADIIVFLSCIMGGQ
jgi:hypothetical protein